MVAVHDLVELGLHLALEPLVLVVDRVAEVRVPVVGADLGCDKIPLGVLHFQRSGLRQNSTYGCGAKAYERVE